MKHWQTLALTLLVSFMSAARLTAQEEGQFGLTGQLSTDFLSYTLTGEYFFQDALAGTVTLHNARNSVDLFGLSLDFGSSTTSLLVGGAYFIELNENMYIPAEVKLGYQGTSIEGIHVGGPLLHMQGTFRYIADSGFSANAGFRYFSGRYFAEDVTNVSYNNKGFRIILGIGYLF